VQDLNLRPKDSGLWPFPASLDYAFAVCAGALRRAPSSLYTFPEGLGSALPCAACGRQVSPTLTPFIRVLSPPGAQLSL